jgi:hypothetical protein
MTMTSETSTIYDVAKTKLAADTQLEYAKATMCRFGGIGVLAAMVGAGIGLACFGYSFVTDGRAQAQKMADAISQALERAQLTTTGEIKLADGSTVSLATGGQVTLAPNSVIRVDPSPTVRVAEIVNADMPPRQTATVTPIPDTTPQNRVVTQFTIFKTVSFGDGHVVTGWIFADSNQTNPANQYCYYSEKADDTIEVKTDLATNGTMLNNLKPRPGMDLIGAYNSCIWYSGNLGQR